MSTHGEWKWQQRGDSLVLDGANGFRVLSIERGVIPTNSDSRLIAASPELLEALERLEAGVRLWMSRGVTDEDMEIARAAIRKARGEA